MYCIFIPIKEIVKLRNMINQKKLPSLFVPHGAPTFILQPGEAGAALVTAAHNLTSPKAILIVSAHWDTAVPTLSVACRPDTIHDFYGFPQELYSIRYPAPGAVNWAMEARSLLEESGFKVELDAKRGLDHGAWVPLKLMYPDATVPVFALSIQSHLGPAHHYRVGQALSSLLAEGVLIIGSGNLTHNLGHFHRLRGGDTVPGYVTDFQKWVQEKLQEQDIESLLDYRQQALSAVEAHPTDEHWMPFYVALGAAGNGFDAELLYSGIQHQMLAMDTYAFWPQDFSTRS